MIVSGYAGALGLGYGILTAGVITIRRGKGIGAGDGGDEELQRRIRGHANFAEYVPLLLGLLALCEHEGALPPPALHACGVALCVARYGHGRAFWTKKKWGLGRVGGTVGTVTVLLTLSSALAYNALVAGSK